MNIKDIKELILTIDQTSIEKVEIENENEKISISKSAGIVKESAVVKNVPHVQEEKNIEIVKEEVKVESKEPVLATQEEGYIVKSPIVGVYYAASSPDAEPLTKVGASVTKGQTLCIIEAMKIMNEIESEVSGEVLEIFVQNEEIVEYGQPLMKIRR